MNFEPWAAACLVFPLQSVYTLQTRKQRVPKTWMGKPLCTLRCTVHQWHWCERCRWAVYLCWISLLTVNNAQPGLTSIPRIRFLHRKVFSDRTHCNDTQLVSIYTSVGLSVRTILLVGRPYLWTQVWVKNSVIFPGAVRALPVNHEVSWRLSKCPIFGSVAGTVAWNENETGFCFAF